MEMSPCANNVLNAGRQKRQSQRQVTGNMKTQPRAPLSVSGAREPGAYGISEDPSDADLRCPCGQAMVPRNMSGFRCHLFFDEINIYISKFWVRQITF